MDDPQSLVALITGVLLLLAMAMPEGRSSFKLGVRWFLHDNTLRQFVRIGISTVILGTIVILLWLIYQ